MHYFNIIHLLFPIFSVLENPKSFSISKPPPRIIRTCCSFGNEVGLAGIPFVKITEIISPENVGNHIYYGGKKEKNGIIYSKKGGFLDTGHLRDIADITAYIYGSLKLNIENGSFNYNLGNEGGIKKIFVKLDNTLTDEDLANIAGKIAYDLSVWHEISTWNGASFIPLVPERYSSFSVEDAFSNLLGVHLGIKAILSPNNYEKEMDVLLKEAFKKYEVVNTFEETAEAMDKVEGIWWSKKAKYPSKNILKIRLFNIYGCIQPMLIETLAYGTETLCVPEDLKNGKKIDDYYTLSIKANFKIPVKKANGSDQKTITQKDFPALIKYAEEMHKNGRIK